MANKINFEADNFNIAESGFTVTVTTSIPLYNGTGTPEGVVTAPVGSLYTDSAGGAGTTLYVKESGTGNTGWNAAVV